MQNKVTILERLIAGFTYLTAGMLGIGWLIFSTVVKKDLPNRFLMFHIMQSILLSLCFVALNFVINLLIKILEFIPFINRLVRQLVYLFNMPFLFGYSIMQCIIYGVLIYLVVFAFLGLYSYIPGISKLIKSKY